MSVTSGTMIMGDSGSGKSSLLATLAKWAWDKHKKVSLLYSTDTGGFPSMLDALIRTGIVRVWKLRTRGEAFESCSRACQGYWPVEFKDPLAGETLPGVKLVPSIRTTYTLYCSKCNSPVASDTNRQGFGQVQICKCGAQVNLQTGYIKEASEVAPFFKDVGVVMYDGLTAQNEWIMGDMADKSGHGLIKGAEHTAMGVITSGDMRFGGSTQNHYGFAQVRSLQWIQDASNIQGLVVGPIFTSRKLRTLDTNSNIRIYGPQIAGVKKTPDVPAWFGNCLGASTLVDSKGVKEWRLYLTAYREPGDEILHLCNTRAAPGTLPDYLSDGPVDPKTGKPANETEPFTKFNLGHFMDMLETATEKTLKETLTQFPDAPGLDYLKSMNESWVEPTKPASGAPTAPKSAAATKPTVKPPVAKPVVKPKLGRPPKPKLRPAPRPGK